MIDRQRIATYGISTTAAATVSVAPAPAATTKATGAGIRTAVSIPTEQHSTGARVISYPACT